MKTEKYLKWITGLSLVGVAISVFSLLEKYGVTSSEFCSINGTFDCTVVNQGIYSEIFGIPVALIGILGYLFMTIAAFMKIRQPSDNGMIHFLVVASLCGLGFSLYLSGIEAFVLETWCLVCLSSQLVMLAIAILVALIFKKEHPRHKKQELKKL